MRMGDGNREESVEGSDPSSPTVQEVQDEEEPEDCEMEIEMVMSYKCRHCSFLCQEKGRLSSHIRATHHHQGNKGKKELLDFSKIKGKKEFGKEEELFLPSIPATPDLYLSDVEEDGEGGGGVPDPAETLDDDVQLVEADGEKSQEIVALRDPYEADNVFLCAECDVVFASQELCCQHMHDVHGLDKFQFNQDFIQDVIVSRQSTGGEGDSPELDEDKRARRKEIKLPKHLTLENGAIVPRKFRVSKNLHSCRKCFLKFEGGEVLKIHEKCHVQFEQSTSTNGNSNEDSNSNDVAGGIGFTGPGASGKKGKGFKCSMCEKGFLKWSLCAGHLWREHQIDCELYSCSVCKVFKSFYITKVKQHEQLHKPETNYACKTCDKKFKQKNQLSSHEKYHVEKSTTLAPPQDSRWYTPKECTICKRILSDAKCLKKHVSAVHNKLKPYCCNICGHMTARKAELKLHVRQHTGEKPFKCPHCSFSTGDHNSLRKHKLRHGECKTYSCPYCEYGSIQSNAFKRHILAHHPGQKVVFQCQQCNHQTVNESLFNAHLKDHEEGRIRNGAIPEEIGNDENSDEDGSVNEYPEIGIRSFDRTKRTVKKSKSPQKLRWLEEDSSVDIIDTGGVTIPASPSSPSASTNPTAHSNCTDKNQQLVAAQQATPTTTCPTSTPTIYILLPPNTPLQPLPSALPPLPPS